MDVRSRDTLLPLLLALCIGGSACDKPLVGGASDALTAGGVEFRVGEYEVRYLEISDGADTFEYPRPVLVLPITVKNVGEGSLVYSPTHQSQQMAETTTPLLYLDPGAGQDLPPESKSLLPGVILEKGSLPGQASTTTLEKGQSVDDLLLFEVPDTALDLVLSIPPSMHREKLPVLFRWKYEPREAVGPKIYQIGQAIDYSGVSFNVSKAELAYVRIKDSAQGEGFSSEPLYKIDLTIKNSSEEAVRYEPGHKAVGARGSALFSSKDSFKRVRFPGTTTVVGQLDTTMIQPGEEVTDFVLFDAPGREVNSLSFEFPAAQFDRSGLARFELPYEFVEVAKPKELTKAP